MPRLHQHNGHNFHLTLNAKGEVEVKYPPYPEGAGRVTVHPQPTPIAKFQGFVRNIDHYNEWVTVFCDAPLQDGPEQLH